MAPNAKSNIAARAEQCMVIDEVDKRKHTKNPFDGKYVDFCLAKLKQVPAPQAPVIDEDDDTHDDDDDDDDYNDDAEACNDCTAQFVESATSNIHARMEIIKSMKLSLVKQTADAVKTVNKAKSNPQETSIKASKNKQGIQQRQDTEQGDAAAATKIADLYATFLNIKDAELEITAAALVQDLQGSKQRLGKEALAVKVASQTTVKAAAESIQRQVTKAMEPLQLCNLMLGAQPFSLKPYMHLVIPYQTCNMMDDEEEAEHDLAEDEESSEAFAGLVQRMEQFNCQPVVQHLDDLIEDDDAMQTDIPAVYSKDVGHAEPEVVINYEEFEGEELSIFLDGESIPAELRHQMQLHRAQKNMPGVTCNMLKAVSREGSFMHAATAGGGPASSSRHTPHDNCNDAGSGPAARPKQFVPQIRSRAFGGRPPLATTVSRTAGLPTRSPADTTQLFNLDLDLDLELDVGVDLPDGDEEDFVPASPQEDGTNDSSGYIQGSAIAGSAWQQQSSTTQQAAKAAAAPAHRPVLMRRHRHPAASFKAGADDTEQDNISSASSEDESGDGGDGNAAEGSGTEEDDDEEFVQRVRKPSQRPAKDPKPAVNYKLNLSFRTEKMEAIRQSIRAGTGKKVKFRPAHNPAALLQPPTSVPCKRQEGTVLRAFLKYLMGDEYTPLVAPSHGPSVSMVTAPSDACGSAIPEGASIEAQAASAADASQTAPRGAAVAPAAAEQLRPADSDHGGDDEDFWADLDVDQLVQDAHASEVALTMQQAPGAGAQPLDGGNRYISALDMLHVQCSDTPLQQLRPAPHGTAGIYAMRLSPEKRHMNTEMHPAVVPRAVAQPLDAFQDWIASRAGTDGIEQAACDNADDDYEPVLQIVMEESDEEAPDEAAFGIGQQGPSDADGDARMEEPDAAMNADQAADTDTCLDADLLLNGDPDPDPEFDTDAGLGAGDLDAGDAAGAPGQAADARLCAVQENKHHRCNVDATMVQKQLAASELLPGGSVTTAGDAMEGVEDAEALEDVDGMDGSITCMEVADVDDGGDGLAAMNQNGGSLAAEDGIKLGQTAVIGDHGMLGTGHRYHQDLEGGGKLDTVDSGEQDVEAKAEEKGTAGSQEEVAELATADVEGKDETAEEDEVEDEDEEGGVCLMLIGDENCAEGLQSHPAVRVLSGQVGGVVPGKATSALHSLRQSSYQGVGLASVRENGVTKDGGGARGLGGLNGSTGSQQARDEGTCGQGEEQLQDGAPCRAGTATMTAAQEFEKTTAADEDDAELECAHVQMMFAGLDDADDGSQLHSQPGTGQPMDDPMDSDNDDWGNCSIVFSALVDDEDDLQSCGAYSLPPGKGRKLMHGNRQPMAPKPTREELYKQFMQKAQMERSKGRVDLRLLMSLLAGALLELDSSTSTISLRQLGDMAKAKLAAQQPGALDAITPQRTLLGLLNLATHNNCGQARERAVQGGGGSRSEWCLGKKLVVHNNNNCNKDILVTLV